jgi:hypothetical protein
MFFDYYRLKGGTSVAHFRCFCWIFYEWNFVYFGKKNEDGKQFFQRKGFAMMGQKSSN